MGGGEEAQYQKENQRLPEQMLHGLLKPIKHMSRSSQMELWWMEMEKKRELHYTREYEKAKKNLQYLLHISCFFFQ